MATPKLPRSGRKKKKKRRRREVDDDIPDPTATVRPSTSTTPVKTQAGSEQKKKRRSNFQIDQASIPQQMNRRQHGDEPIKIKKRHPRGHRQIVAQIDNDIDLDNVDDEYRKKTDVPILEDISDPDDMDIDENDDDDIDRKEDAMNPWGDDDGDRGYNPVTSKDLMSTEQDTESSQCAVPDVLREKVGEFLFMQLPPVLPMETQLSMDDKADLEKKKFVQKGLLRQMGDGQIGTIRVRKSGKTKFVIGDYVLDMDFASPMDCYQKVLHLHCQNSQNGVEGRAQFLGDVPAQNRLVCSYKVRDLIEMQSAVKTEHMKNENRMRSSMKIDY